MRDLVLRAWEHGAVRKTAYRTDWDLSGDCLNPVGRELVSRPGAPLRTVSYIPWDHVIPSDGDGPPLRYTEMLSIPGELVWDAQVRHWLCLTLRCRKCDNCRMLRSRTWAARAIAEFRLAPRTWFGTCTLSPEWHERFAASARLKAVRRRLGDFEALPLGQQCLMRHEQIGHQWTKVFKRLRKTGAQFRYLLVMEPHESGLPHYHLLVHEIGAPIRKRTLDHIWPFGEIVQWRLVEDVKRCMYVTKYLSKNGSVRVRASTHYGSRETALASSKVVQPPRETDLTRQAPLQGVRGAPPPEAKPVFKLLNGDGNV